MRIGLTGGIASGKSTVSRMLRERGARIIDADVIAREVVLPGTRGAEQVRAAFGDRVFLPGDVLDRRALGAVVFGDAHKRNTLEKILHPLILQESKRQMDAYQKAYPDGIAVYDAALLIESGMHTWVDSVWLVFCDKKTQLARIMERDGLNEEQARARIASQMPLEQKKHYANRLIDNSGSLEETARQVDAYLAEEKRNYHGKCEKDQRSGSAD